MNNSESENLQLNSSESNDKVGISTAISLLNDLRYLLVRIDGDIGFRVIRKESLRVGVQDPFLKFLHSTIFQARSVWFRNGLKKWHETNMLDGFVIESEKCSLKVTPSLEDNQLILTLENVHLSAFQELGI